MAFCGIFLHYTELRKISQLVFKKIPKIGQTDPNSTLWELFTAWHLCYEQLNPQGIIL